MKPQILSVKYWLAKFFIVFILLQTSALQAQDTFGGFKDLFTTPLNYVVTHVSKAPVIDGSINDSQWQQARWTTDFQDIKGDQEPKPYYKTKVKMLWGDSCLYIAARLQDPHVWATFTHHDDVIYRENDFELFIDPVNTTHNYYEIEVNALNSIFDLVLTKPYRNGGKPVIDWNAPGLRSAVKVEGTLNKTTDTDKGWTVEMAIPFKALNAGTEKILPKDGSLWRINFSRVQYDTKAEGGRYIKLKDSTGHNLPERNWVWSSQGLINMHYPERWGYLLFNKGATGKTFKMPYAELQKKYLWLIYYRQKEWIKANAAYATKLNDLSITDTVTIEGVANTIKMEAEGQRFTATIKSEKTKITYTINQDGLIKPIITQAHE